MLDLSTPALAPLVSGPPAAVQDRAPPAASGLASQPAGLGALAHLPVSAAATPLDFSSHDDSPLPWASIPIGPFAATQFLNAPHGSHQADASAPPTPGSVPIGVPAWQAAPKFYPPSNLPQMWEVLGPVIQKSPLLMNQLDQVRQNGWRIEWSDSGPSMCDHNQKLIRMRSDHPPALAMQLLAHEVGHTFQTALLPQQFSNDYDSAAAVVMYEGQAVLNQFLVADEIEKNGGPSIGYELQNAEFYKAAFQAWQQHGDTEKLLRQIESMYGWETCSASGGCYWELGANQWRSAFGMPPIQLPPQLVQQGQAHAMAALQHELHGAARRPRNPAAGRSAVPLPPRRPPLVPVPAPVQTAVQAGRSSPVSRRGSWAPTTVPVDALRRELGEVQALLLYSVQSELAVLRVQLQRLAPMPPRHPDPVVHRMVALFLLSAMASHKAGGAAGRDYDKLPRPAALFNPRARPNP
ncbi:hypothetical protein GT347_19205 [Xylophilus rhododendri]|uniref:Uncharacterized protein n=1 Tax=Xylophilus rhododendri TaxID=2697032 RepID=A0A857J9X0_9BURK|nr:hypothetical protein [Xylophilus rhododendri]QHI99921.1 hypothetical protein GT347_19205 [Xylophilus rhododendri]